MQHKVRLLLILLINKKVAKTLSNTTAVDGKQGEPTTSRVSKIISKIGAKANVVVDTNKTASAHDLRRSFGEQWASNSMPAQLMEIMRHESIDTTMKYYVGKNAERTAAMMATVKKQSQKEVPNEHSDFCNLSNQSSPFRL